MTDRPLGNRLPASRKSVREPLLEADIAPADNSRYTLDGDADVEARIHADQQLIGAAVTDAMPADQFRALVLMGGYGRGEGGFAMHDGQPAPYNDYDYFIVVKGLTRAQRQTEQARMQPVAHALEPRVGIDVDFFLLREEDLPNAEYSLMNAEMKWGHRVVAGDQGILDSMPTMPITGLSLGEFSRLMINRGSLLLMNKHTQANGGPDDDIAREQFVKYLFKAILASADALLAAQRHYHPSYPVKQQWIDEIAAMEAITDSENGHYPGDRGWPVTLAKRLVPHYRLALEARFHPDYRAHIQRDLSAWLDQVIAIWLDAYRWLEQARSGRNIEDWSSYAAADFDKGQSAGGLKAQLRNMAITARDYGVGALLANLSRGRRYPRERLLAALPLLLAQSDESAQISGILSTGATQDFVALADAYLAQWHRYA